MASTIEFETDGLDVLATLHSGLIGDDRALDAFVRLCQPHVLTYVASRGAEHPEALTNLVLSEFVQSAPSLSFDYPQQLWSYIYRIARSRLADERRKAGREIRAERIELADVEIAGFDGRSVDTIWVDGLLAELTTEQREVIRYRFWEDLTIEDTALRTGRTDTAVKALQRRALAALAAAVAVAAAVVIVLTGANPMPSRVQSSDPADRPTSSQPDSPTPDADRATTQGRSGAGDDPAGRQARFDRSDAPHPTTTTSATSSMAPATAEQTTTATNSTPATNSAPTSTAGPTPTSTPTTTTTSPPTSTSTPTSTSAPSPTTTSTSILRPGPEDFPRLAQELADVLAQLAMEAERTNDRSDRTDARSGRT